MNARVLLIAIAIAAWSTPAAVAQARSAYLAPSNNTAAVDAKGVRHRGEEYRGRLPPWMVDRLRSPSPDYPYGERAQRHAGSGYFRLTLNLKTGSVTRATVLKSTGFSTLDSCAVAALRQWRWKPRKWKEIDTGLTFRLSYSEPQLPRGSVPLPLR